MVLVSIKLKDGLITGFEIKGHAGYAESGKDIICSAISAIGYTTIGYFENKYNPDEVPEKSFYTENDGHINWNRPETSDTKKNIEDNAVLDAMIIGFKQIEYTYGSKYITVKMKEV